MDEPKQMAKLPESDKGWQTWLQNRKPGPQREWVSMKHGLVVVIEPSGLKTFQARLRLADMEHARRVRLGASPAMSVAEARQEIATVKSAARNGADPSLERRRAASGHRQLTTLSDLIVEYLSRRDGRVAPKTMKLEREQLAVIERALGNRRFNDIKPQEIGDAINDYAQRLRNEGGTGTNANKALAAAKRLFKRAKGWGIVDTLNPAIDLERPTKEVPRKRILFDGEVLVDPTKPAKNETGKLVAALLDPGGSVWGEASTKLALLMSLTMGFRSEEVCALQWEFIDLEATPPLLTVCKSKTDTGLRTIPIPPFMASRLRDQRTQTGGGQFVFPGRRAESRRPHLHPESLGRSFARATKTLAIPGATHHDLRRTCVSGLSELGFESIVRRIVGHKAKDVTGRNYDHSRRLPEMTRALSSWEDAVLASVHIKNP